ncbi:MAG TPA: class I SAM-dependent methyltransferase [Streptosporangiaceae bacterium]|nr:class I SAM-dependent methyltransferase [Streptosporangiaceae bacterium]
MNEVHEIAARGFGAEADAYDRARPSYPPDAIEWLVKGLGIGPGRQVVDLAAGTGKLTSLLAGAGADLIAIEPVASMRDRLRELLPQVPVLAGVAEALPLADRSVDAVIVAQAFHWFEAKRTMAELARVIRPGGRLGLLWNARDRSLEWVDQVWSVMDRVERHAPWRAEDGGGSESTHATTERYLAGPHDGNWSPWVEATFFHVHYSTHDQVVDRMRSVSHIAALPPDDQCQVLDEVRMILDGHPETRRQPAVGIPYRVDAMYAERIGR